ncbi:MAG: DNA cytosine methyltransferase, partial [Candidatus Adiutrix sp.]
MPAVIDLFCGIGGLTHGLVKAGLEVIAGVDLDPSCRYAFEHNNRKAKFMAADAASLSSEEIIALYEKFSHRNPEDKVRILVGCAPCQPFSKYTKRYRKGEKNGGRANDVWQQDNKWRLLYSFADLVRQVAPDIVSMENVPELAKEKVFIDFTDS